MNEFEPSDRQVSIYNRMMERVRHALEDAEHKAHPNLEHAIERARKRAIELGEATREEAANVANYLRRDIREMASYMNDTGKEYNAWFHMDMELIEARLLDLIMGVADKTRVELAQLAQEAQEPASYYSNEITGPGMLECVACGERQTYSSTRVISFCPRCQAGEFRRVSA
jgi:predicted  nucleic acid-binding Zn-ribbon protein